MPLWEGNWPDSSCPTVVSTSRPKSCRCSSEIVAFKYWISGKCFRTKTTKATSGIPLIQE